MIDVATNLGVEVRSIDTIVDCDTSIRSILQQRSLPYRFRVVEGILLRGETTSWHEMDAGGRIHLTINQLWAWASCGCAFRECTSTRHTREENTVTFTANNNKNGRGNAEEGNCDGNKWKCVSFPILPRWGAIGGGVGIEYVHHEGLMQQHHALNAHDNLQHDTQSNGGMDLFRSK